MVAIDASIVARLTECAQPYAVPSPTKAAQCRPESGQSASLGFPPAVEVVATVASRWPASELAGTTELEMPSRNLPSACCDSLGPRPLSPLGSAPADSPQEFDTPGFDAVQ